jgi:Alr-MurF fusion protein
VYQFSALTAIIGGRIVQQCGDKTFSHLLTDSRKLLFADQTIFFALAGQRRSGNSYISELYQKGVRCFVTGVPPHADADFAAASIIVVPNVLEALQKMAAYHRQQFHYPVIGITGSNGKTMVKEWLYQTLHPHFNIVRSPKSYNSQIGVPISVWNMQPVHNLALFEAGISLPGEMQQLQKIIRPTIGVFTNIGDAHSEGFANSTQKIREKLQLFTQSTVIICNADDELLYNEINAFTQAHAITLFSSGAHPTHTLQILSISRVNGQSLIRAQSPVRKIAAFEISIPFTDEASIQNAITCLAIMLYLQIDIDSIKTSMAQLKPVEMRLELKKAINGCAFVNDSYSADINSLAIALDFVHQQQPYKKRTVVLSDILQSSLPHTQLYQNVAKLLAQKGIDRLIGIGAAISKQQAHFAAITDCVFFETTTDFKARFHQLHFGHEIILLKGARQFEFEQIAQLLEQQVHQTVLEVNLTAISNNLKQFQQLLHPKVKLMAMVKAFSYGSGSYEIASLLQFHRIDYLAVAFADEGVELRKSGISLPIMVMSPTPNSFDTLVAYNLEPELYSFEILNQFSQHLDAAGIAQYPVHIKLDTGMHRLGFEPKDVPALVQQLKQSNLFKIQSVFSHLVASDNALHDAFTLQQQQLYEQGYQQIQQGIPYTILRHIANTAAIVRHPQLQMDMVRLGIGLYGLEQTAGKLTALQHAVSLKTTIAQIKQVKAGDSVGYSRAAIVEKDSTIATVRIGYADGYPRNLSNGKGWMLVAGKRVPVVGNVCMDMTMLNITGVAAKTGDEVIVFGPELPVSELAKWASTISYEIIAGISQRVKRVYYDEA